MTNEEIAREATGQITDGSFAWWQSNKVELIYATILAAINRAQSESLNFMYTITPVKHYLAVTLHNLPAESHIVRPDTTEPPVYAKVVAIGPECKRISVGDCVAFQPTSVVCHMEALDQYIIPEDAIVCLFHFNDTP